MVLDKAVQHNIVFFTGDDNLMNETEKISKKKSHPKHYRAPLYTSAAIFLGSAVLFGGWKCFFDTSINGSWGLELNLPDSDEKINYNFTFDGNGGLRYQSGGQTAIGKYFLGTENGKSLLTVFLTNGDDHLSAKFNYSIGGNVFSGRSLELTDLSGFYFTADTEESDKETIEAKKKITDSVTEDGTTYYKWKFVPSNIKIKQDKPENFTPDKAILGTWFYKAEEPTYSYTFTFNDDGTFEQYNSQNEIFGSYNVVSDGKLKVSYYSISNTQMEGELTYSLNGDKLTIGSHEFEKTNDKYAFNTEIK